MLRSARRRVATLLLPVGAIVLSTVAAGFAGAPPASAAGILPPSNPSANIAPDNPDWLTSINDARSHEGVGAMNVSESALGALPIDQQVLTVVNDERIDRGEQPIDYVTSQLDSYAQGGANAGTDPTFPSSRDRVVPPSRSADRSGPAASRRCSRPTTTGRTTTATAARRRPTRPAALSNPSGCWGHRDIILHQFAGCPSGPPVLSMGAAFSPNGYPGGSIAAIFVSTCSPPTDITASWGKLATSVQSSSRTVAIAPTPNGTGYWEVEANGTVGSFGSAAELRLPQRPAQRADRGHGLDARRQGVLAGRHRRRHLQLR